MNGQQQRNSHDVFY